MSEYSIPFFKPYFGGNEEKYVKSVLENELLPKQSFIDIFEKDFAKFNGRRYAVAVSNGTSALHLLIKYSENKLLRSVVTTPLTFVASANVALYEKQNVVFCDIGENLLIDENSLEAILKSNRDISTVVYVDIFGRIPDSGKIREICDKHNVFLIEDASQALGSKNKSFNAGQLGHSAVFSFNKNKQITSGGEGGMIVTDDEKIYKFCKSMRDQGRVDGVDWLDHAEIGYNYRMTEIQASIGCAQMEQINDFLEKRRFVVLLYKEKLKNLTHIHLPDDIDDSCKSWFIFYIIVNNIELKNRIISQLHDAGIECKTNYFPPVYKFKAYKSIDFHSNIAENFYEGVIALPLYYEMTEVEVNKIAEIIREC